MGGEAMSIKLLSKVFEDETLKGGQKSVMLAIADNSSDNPYEFGTCFPSIDLIAVKAGLSRKSVITNINKLVENGYLIKAYRSRKTGGRTSNKYLIYPSETMSLLDEEHKVMFTQSEETTLRNKITQSEETTPPKQTQSEETTPEPSLKDINPNLKYSDCPENIAKEIWVAFIDFRKKKKAPLTLLAWNGLLREFSKANLGSKAGLILMMEKSWRGFEAEWVRPKQNTSNNQMPTYEQRLNDIDW